MHRNDIRQNPKNIRFRGNLHMQAHNGYLHHIACNTYNQYWVLLDSSPEDNL